MIIFDPDREYYADQRLLKPEDFLGIIQGILGVIGVTRVARITDLDRVGIPVYSTIRPSAARGAVSVYSGKGINDVHARISAIMEGVERCLAEPPSISNDLKKLKKKENGNITGTYADVSRKFAVVDPKLLGLPKPVDSNIIEWMQGWDIVQEKEVMVPANSVYHPYFPAMGTVQLFRSNTNGLAAGAAIEDAVLHGLFEVIERDALSIAQAKKKPGKQISLSEKDGMAYEFFNKLENAGIAVKLWLLDSDIAVPTVAAALDDTVLRDPALLVMGAGAHLDPKIAVLRALTEAAQSRVIQIQGAREDTTREKMVRAIGYDKIRESNRFWFMAAKEKIRLSDIPDASGKRPVENIKKTLEFLKTAADRVIVVDLSREEIPVPAVRVIVPGLEMYWVDTERKGERVLGKTRGSPIMSSRRGSASPLS